MKLLFGCKLNPSPDNLFKWQGWDKRTKDSLSRPKSSGTNLNPSICRFYTYEMWVISREWCCDTGWHKAWGRLAKVSATSLEETRNLSLLIPCQTGNGSHRGERFVDKKLLMMSDRARKLIFDCSPWISKHRLFVTKTWQGTDRDNDIAGPAFLYHSTSDLKQFDVEIERVLHSSLVNCILSKILGCPFMLRHSWIGRPGPWT